MLQRRAWLLLGWVTADRSCPCKQPACPVVGGGSEVTFSRWSPVWLVNLFRKPRLRLNTYSSYTNLSTSHARRPTTNQTHPNIRLNTYSSYTNPSTSHARHCLTLMIEREPEWLADLCQELGFRLNTYSSYTNPSTSHARHCLTLMIEREPEWLADLCQELGFRLNTYSSYTNPSTSHARRCLTLMIG
ncbi:hypothetical protein J6590_055515 [Homalodisca vitripennis]|nr:hypothetical protein J6590_055515 [Homalodisca vitripennis]